MPVDRGSVPVSAVIETRNRSPAVIRAALRITTDPKKTHQKNIEPVLLHNNHSSQKIAKKKTPQKFKEPPTKPLVLSRKPLVSLRF
jgi:hypothetical protein